MTGDKMVAMMLEKTVARMEMMKEMRRDGVMAVWMVVAKAAWKEIQLAVCLVVMKVHWTAEQMD